MKEAAVRATLAETPERVGVGQSALPHIFTESALVWAKVEKAAQDLGYTPTSWRGGGARGEPS